jgi:uncharacterized membrane protein
MALFKEWIAVVGYGIEAFGVLIMLVGSAVGTLYFLAGLRSVPLAAGYSRYRRGVGRSIILGLEFLIAGDVIRTVVVSHSVSSVAVLALIVLIRTFLSFTLALEIEGRLPWQVFAAKAPPP